MAGLNAYSIATYTHFATPQSMGAWRAPILGLDGKLYAAIPFEQNPSQNPIFCLDTQTTLVTLTSANWNTDWLAQSGISITWNNTYVVDIFPLEGTNYFLALKVSTSASPPVVGGIYYQVDAGGNFVADDWFVTESTTLENRPYRQSNFQRVFSDARFDPDGNLVLAGNLTTSSGSEFEFTPTLVTLTYPFTGDHRTLGPAWEDMCEQAPFGNNYSNANLNTDNIHDNRVQIMFRDLGAGAFATGLITYVRYSDIHSSLSPKPAYFDGANDSAVWYWESGDVSYTDITSRFVNIPFTDQMMTYDDTASSDQTDDYSTPQRITIGGDDYLAFTRQYAQQITPIDPHRYDCRIRLYPWTNSAIGAQVYDYQGTILGNPEPDTGGFNLGGTLGYPAIFTNAKTGATNLIVANGTNTHYYFYFLEDVIQFARTFSYTQIFGPKMAPA